MSDNVMPNEVQREAESSQAKRKEGFGAVPNINPDQTGDTEQLVEAAHQFEEEKGDWGKDR